MMAKTSNEDNLKKEVLCQQNIIAKQHKDYTELKAKNDRLREKVAKGN